MFYSSWSGQAIKAVPQIVAAHHEIKKSSLVNTVYSTFNKVFSSTPLIPNIVFGA